MCLQCIFIFLICVSKPIKESVILNISQKSEECVNVGFHFNEVYDNLPPRGVLLDSCSDGWSIILKVIGDGNPLETITK